LSEPFEQGIKNAGRMWPAKAFCAARDAVWDHRNSQTKCSLESEQVP